MAASSTISKKQNAIPAQEKRTVGKFTVQFISTSTRRRVSAAANQRASPTSLIPQPGKNTRTDLQSTMVQQETMVWEEQQVRRSRLIEQDAASATISGDPQAEMLALKLMVSEAVYRQAKATPRESQRFIETVGHASLKNKKLQQYQMV